MNTRARLTALLLAMAALLSSVCGSMVYADDLDEDDYYTDSNYYSPGQEENPVPVLKMSSDGIFNFEKGEERDVDILIKNVSSFYAYNILVQPVASGENIPFDVAVLDKSNTKYFLQHTTTMKLRLRISVDENAKSGTYPLTLNYSFTAKNKSGFTGSDTLYIKINGDAPNTSVTLDGFGRSAQRVEAGGRVELFAELKNDGSEDAKNVNVALTGLTPETIGMEEGSNSYNFGLLKRGASERLTFTLTVGSEVKTGSYPLTYKLTYNDADDKEVTKEFGYYVNVVNADEDNGGKTDLTVSVSEPAGTYGVGQVFSVKLTVKNTGESKTEDIVITALGNKDNAVVPRSTAVKQIKELAVGEERSYSFDFAATSEAGSKNYPLGFDIEYRTGAKTEEGYETRKFTQYSGVNIYNPDKENEDEEGKDEDKKTSTPKIIISRYKCDPVIVEAGKSFNVEMTFKNTHPVKTIKNIRLYLTVDEETEEKGNVFTPDKASNTYYINEITPGGEVSHTFNMFTVPDADARTYSLNVNFEYEDAEFNEYKSTELVGINVKQKAELTTSDIIVPADANMGEGMGIAFDLYNTGKVTLSNVMVRVEGEGFDTSSATYYAGTMDAGASDMYEGTVMPMDMGSHSGRVIISYEDSSGEKHEKVQDFTVNVQEAVPMDDYGEGFEEEMPDEGEAKSRLPLLLGIGAAVLVFAFIIGVIIKKCAARRRERELSE